MLSVGFYFIGHSSAGSCQDNMLYPGFSEQWAQRQPQERIASDSYVLHRAFSFSFYLITRQHRMQGVVAAVE